MKHQLCNLTKWVILCAVFGVFTNLAPSIYVRAKTSEADEAEEFMPPVPVGKKW